MTSLYELMRFGDLGNIDAIRRSLAAGADPNFVEHGYSPLMRVVGMYACNDFKLATIELLLQHGADVNWRNSDGETTWSHAICNPCLDRRIANALQAAGAHL